MSDAQLDDLVQSVKESAASEDKSKKSTTKFFTKRLRYPILFAFLIAAFNQLSGINMILIFMHQNNNQIPDGYRYTWKI